MPRRAASQGIEQYCSDGYCSPLRVLCADEARACRARLEAFEVEHGGPLRGDRRHNAHLFLTWLDELTRHPAILDPVEDVIGPNIFVWNSTFFIKEGRTAAYVAWHQDSTVFGARAPDVVTAWVAFTDSTSENGAMRVIPGSHRHGQLSHWDTRVPDNMLTRGQEVAVGIDESQAVTVTLQAGEMSLHHAHLLHGSLPNGSNDRRIGVAIRYVRPSATRGAGQRGSAMLVRGVDECSDFDAEARPARDCAPEALALHAEIMRCYRAAHQSAVHVVSNGWQKPVVFRGALVVRAGRGILILGPGGAEKSALAAGLAQRGWSWARDDVTVIAPEKSRRCPPDGSDPGGRPVLASLAATVFLSRRVGAPRPGELVPLPPAHALLALLPYSRLSDVHDPAKGLQHLQPLVEAVPAYEAGCGPVDEMVRVVESLLDRSPVCRSEVTPLKTIGAQVGTGPEAGGGRESVRD